MNDTPTRSHDEPSEAPEGLGASSQAGTSASLDTLLHALDRESASIFGRQGEDIARLALWRSPATRGELVSVQPWADWVHQWNVEHPDRSEQVTDRGIDLVATYADGHHTAVQVKLRDGRGAPVSVGWEKLSTFAAKSAIAPFTDRLLILLGDATLSSNARDELARQPALTIWSAAEIETHAGDQWPADHAGVLAALGSAPAQAIGPRPLHGYQLDAVADGEAVFGSGADRAQLLMACGTGKTITTHGLADALNARRLLVLAPSLSLLRQLIGEYRWQYGGQMSGIAVCSDNTVGTATPGEDADDPRVIDAELGVPTVADPAQIGAFLATSTDDRPRVVFATYQSSARVAEAQAVEGVPKFDLVVADEAHYLAGRPSSAFATVLDSARIRASRRLFATATPRLVAPHLRASDPEVWASMDDPAVFGPVAHRLPFGAAIAGKLLSDYRLLVLGADEQAAAAIDTRALVDAGAVTDARTLAAALAVLRLAREHGRRRIVTFHSRRTGARAFARLLETHHAWAPPELHVDLAAETVTGDQPTDQRAAVLARLARAGDAGQPAVRVLTNARCLTAGVDVPALDAVVFVDPRRSRVDVVQAIGRVLRRAENKDLGYVVVPVPIPEDTDAEAAVTGSSFAPVWEVLAALADHDDVLADEIEQARRALGRTGQVGREGRHRLVVDVPGVSSAELAGSVWLAGVTRVGSGWAQGFGALQAFVSDHGHARVPQKYQTADGFALGSWASSRRMDRTRGRLSAERITALDSMGFVWDPGAEDFARGLTALAAFVAANGHPRVPRAHRTEGGFTLGAWVSGRRQDRKVGRLTEERITALDALGFVWDAGVADFARGLAALKAYVATNGHARVPRSHRSEDGFALGSWVVDRRRARTRGRLTDDQVAALESTGMVWDPYGENFARGLAELEAYVAEWGDSRVPQNFRAKNGFALGAWVSNRRRDWKQERLSAEQSARLEALGFVWDQTADQFSLGLAALEAFVVETGHARVPQRHRTEDGFALGSWVSARRADRRRGQLARHQVAALNAVGFVWGLSSEGFTRGLAELTAFVDETGHARVPSSYRTPGGFALGAWVTSRRRDRAEERLTASEIAALDATGFVWDTRGDDFASGLAALEAFVAETGHACVPQKYRTQEGFTLGSWVSSRRQDGLKGRLADDRMAALQALGFVWDAWEWDFTRGLAALEAFVAKTGHARVPQRHQTEDGFGLGAWVRNRRQDRKVGRLAAERIAALEAVGFAW
ncbi:Helicase associated domain protein [Geodermatophilus sp. SYSU D00705]